MTIWVFILAAAGRDVLAGKDYGQNKRWLGAKAVMQ
jgi:hypothetical protein